MISEGRRRRQKRRWGRARLRRLAGAMAMCRRQWRGITMKGVAGSVVRFAWMAVVCAGYAFGQTSLEGTVADAEGRGVAGATLTLQHEDGRTAATAKSENDGR